MPIGQLQETHLTCPTCRQIVPLKYNYSFSYYTGEDQKYLWFTAIFFLVDFISTVYYNKPFLIIQSACIIIFPFIIRSKKDLTFFLFSYRIRFMMDYMLLVSAPLYIPGRFDRTIQDIEKYRYLHLCILVFFTSYKKPYNNPLLPYAISADVIHKDTLAAIQKQPSSRLSKLVASSLKRNKRSCKS